MKITTTIKLDSTKETINILLDKKTKLRYLIMVIFSILLFIISLIIRNNACLILSILSFILNVLTYVFLVKAKEDVQTKAFKKIYPKEEYILDVEFKKNKIDFINNHFTKKVIIEYEEIKELKESKNYIVMILTNKTHFLFNKKDVTLEEIKERINRVKK